MAYAIIHFEDVEKIAVVFRNLLAEKGVDDLDDHWTLVPYLTSDVNKTKTTVPQDPSKVAQKAAEWLEKKNPDRLVLITDLTPVGGGSMETYGLEVLAKLADYMSTNHNGKLWVANVKDLVEDKRILVVFLTKLGSLGSIFKNHDKWKDININMVGYCGKDPRPTVHEALKELQEDGGAIIYADRSKDMNWASNLIVNWVKR